MQFLLVTCLVCVLMVNGSYWHPHQVPYVGDSIKYQIDEIKFCSKDICVVDASRMGLWMNESANPCENIYQYVCGTFMHYQALNERYLLQGLQQILYETISEQRRKVLADPIKPDDIRPHKIAKSFFQQCVNSRKVEKFGKRDFLSFMKGLGGFPMIEGNAWNSTKFNLSRLFVDYPTLMFDFFDLGFKIVYYGSYSDFGYISANVDFENGAIAEDADVSPAVKDMLQDLGIRYSSDIAEQLNDLGDFIRTFFVGATQWEEERVTSISAFNEFMNSNLSKLHVDWKQALSYLLDSEVNDDFPIIAIEATVLQEKMKRLDTASDRVVANYVFMRLLTKYRHTISLYSATKNEQVLYGTQRASQRFEQCVKLIRENLPEVFTSLLVKKFTNKRMIDDAHEIAKRTMNLIGKVVENDESIPTEHRTLMVEKLKVVKLILGYPNELLEDKNVENLYKSLNLIGNETFLELFLQSSVFATVSRYRRYVRLHDSRGKIIRNESTKWTDFTTETETFTPSYVMNHENFIYYPSLWFQPPYFNPDRPRYYKDSMFAIFLAYTVNNGLKKYMEDNQIPSKNGRKNHFDFISAIYEKYAEWDDKHHEDLPLPGFLFSNKQLFWFTLIHKNCAKLQPGYAGEWNAEAFAVAYFQDTKVFQEAFGCKFREKTFRSGMFQKKYNDFF